MKLQDTTKNIFFNVLKLFYLVLILLVLLSVATYTWFSLSRAPKINDMSLYVTSAAGLQIAIDKNAPDEEWGQNLIYGEHYEDNTVLRPVSSSDHDGVFYAAEVGLDGRINAVDRMLYDSKNANRSDINGYYAKFSFYARTDDNVSVELIGSASDEAQGTYVVGMPEWDSEEIIHNNGGRGLECAIRIGFRIVRYDADGIPLDQFPIFKIYEPNCDGNLDYTRGYVPTPSIDGTPNLVSDDRLIRQERTAWLEASPVQKDVLVYQHGAFVDDTHLFDLDSGCHARIEVYLWLEGQDADCIYQSEEAAKIIASIQFLAKTRPQSGMDPIE